MYLNLVISSVLNAPIVSGFGQEHQLKSAAVVAVETVCLFNVFDVLMILEFSGLYLHGLMHLL